MGRLRELDFLRGVAIVLVLFRHIRVFSFTENMGWIGVDLFFVLSGFLISGLLFKEYLEFGNINPKLFLIRRGFKIYPIYYLFYFPYINFNDLDIIGFISDLTFTQNYVWGFGYAYVASWSLAVEEHFYFGFVFILWLSIKYRERLLLKLKFIQSKVMRFEIIAISILIICLLMRLTSNIIFPLDLDRNFTMTHLRIDSLVFGVYISYLYYFKNARLVELYRSRKHLLYVIAFLGLIWTPFINLKDHSFFVETFGFTLVYFSFGVILIAFLMEKNINLILNKLFSPPIVTLVSEIGVCSYSIYIIHTFVIKKFLEFDIPYFTFYGNPYSFFLVVSLTSILIGMLMTYTVEKYFLSLRNRYYPSRILAVDKSIGAN